MLRHDFIQRLIEKMAAFIARLAKLVDAGRVDEAAGELQALERELGLPRGCGTLDARSVALILGNADKIALASILHWHQSEIAAERGLVAEAARLELRSRELYAAVARSELSRPTLELLASHPVGKPRPS